MQAPEQPTSEPGCAQAEVVYCLLCGETLTCGTRCDKCQLSREAIERIFRAEKLEEARSPCGPLVLLGVIVMVAVIGVAVVVCAGLLR
jgi:hypothetical protein